MLLHHPAVRVVAVMAALSLVLVGLPSLMIAAIGGPLTVHGFGIVTVRVTLRLAMVCRSRLPMISNRFLIVDGDSFVHKLAPRKPPLIVIRMPPGWARIRVTRGHIHLHLHAWGKGDLGSSRNRGND